ncbi:hypothetical protein IGI04_033496 [Brassica rapa subsp. trilocularis]|uniref:Peptidase M3A/M3B catalytic domain-containing protein n=1 Tax=Brassica rapa subsp. trilocularis TaxID=1813537 RepID=A0ABQ7L9V0_BRACM|nr:hypothetical protein IGI04_033496 [Brassica rapa subsp. trilocularis]
MMFWVGNEELPHLYAKRLGDPKRLGDTGYHSHSGSSGESWNRSSGDSTKDCNFGEAKSTGQEQTNSILYAAQDDGFRYYGGKLDDIVWSQDTHVTTKKTVACDINEQQSDSISVPGLLTALPKDYFRVVNSRDYEIVIILAYHWEQHVSGISPSHWLMKSAKHSNVGDILPLHSSRFRRYYTVYSIKDYIRTLMWTFASSVFLDVQVMLGLPVVEGTNHASCFPRAVIGSEATCYSRLWSEVFAADIFASQFGDGHPNLYMGLQFRDKVLAQGGGNEAMELLTSFLGREPSTQAYIES